MTLLCSPKVTHHHGQLGVVVSRGKDRFSCRGASVAVAGPAAILSPGTGSTVNALRAVGADEVKSTPHAWRRGCYRRRCVLPWGKSFLRVGHSNRAQVGHFSRAPTSRGIEGRRFRPEPWRKVRTKTCPLFEADRVWHDGQCPRNRMNFSRALFHQAARSMSMTGCLSRPREPNE